MRRSSASSVGSTGSNSSQNNSMFSRVKKFQICIWITVAFTFLHLGTKPMVTPPEKMQAKNKTKTTTNNLPLTTEDTTSGKESNPITTPTPTSATNPIHTSDDKKIPTPAAIDPVPAETKPNAASVSAPAPPPPTTPPTTKASKNPAPKPTSKPRPEPAPLIDSSSFTIKTPEAHTDNNNDAIANKFVEQYCDLKNLKDGAWYPSGDDAWQQRAPYVIIAGTWNSGVNHLANALLMHPQIFAANVHGFFLPRTFNRKFVTKTPNNKVILSNATNNADSVSSEAMTIQVFAARDRMYHAVYSPSSLRDSNSTASDAVADNDATERSKSKLVAMDISPGLLFYAHTTSHSVVCVSPWSKIVILLRNPVDRLYQQWLYSKTKLSLSLSLEDWVAREMVAMQSAGLIQGNDKDSEATAQDATPISERDAWNKYQQVSSSTGAALGRSMYVLQMTDWIQTYLDAGKKPSDEIIIVASEELEGNPSGKYSEMIQFLGLAPVNTTKADKGNGFLSAISKPVPPTGVEPMKKETRNMLEQFFQPYNKRLAKLLKEQGFEGDWDKVWK